MSANPTAAACARLKGHSVVICACRTADSFLDCPAEAQGKLTPTYPPEAYRRATTLPDGRGYHRITAAEPERPPSRSSPPVLTVVYNGGYTGSICDVCGGARMRRSGTCETCDDCGNAGGCG